MKHLTALTLISMITLSSFSQAGIKAGINTTYFNQGDKTYSGIKHSYQSITAGIFYKTKHLQYELLFSQGGAKNPNESNRTFKASYIHMPITLAHNFGSCNIQFGGYISKIISAKNNDFYTPGLPNFSWRVGNGSWPWYQSWDYGLTAGLGVNLHPVYLEAHYRQGLRNVRQYDYDAAGVYDPSYQKCLNAGFDVSLYVPFKL